MQLHVARLCLDCQEVHDERACPRCTSESFALLSKWVPAPERRARTRPPVETSEVETYRQLLATPDDREQGSRRWLKRGALLAAVSVGGWLWQRKFSGQASKPADTPKPGSST
jgi:hypothetical protein